MTVPESESFQFNGNQDVGARLQLANRIAVAAGKLTLKHFRDEALKVIRKGDGSPLTIADQEAETFLRKEIQKAFPGDGIVGEEFGVTEGGSGFNWILDPIDGTKSFICGVPLYGTMVAVEKMDVSGVRQSVIGSVYLPGIDEGMFASTGQGAWHFKKDLPAVRARVSSTGKIENAVLVTSEVETFGERNAADVYQRLADSVYFARTWGDVYGYLLVATGQVDVMIDPMLNVWDAAAVQPIIEEAGGRFSDWSGDGKIDTGDAIGSNGLFHDELLAIVAEE